MVGVPNWDSFARPDLGFPGKSAQYCNSVPCPHPIQEATLLKWHRDGEEWGWVAAFDKVLVVLSRDGIYNFSMLFFLKKKNGIFTIRQNVHIYLRRCVAIFISYQHSSGRWDITLGMCKAGVGTEAGGANYNLERKCIFFAFYTFSPVSSLCFNTSRHRHWTLWPVKWETQLTLAHLCPKFSALPYASLKTIHILYQRRLN